MSFEFTNKIQELTNKLQHIKQNQTKNDRLQEVKQQLKALEHALNKELIIAEKRIKNVESKVQKRLQQLKEYKKSAREMIGTKQEKVSELIGEWVDEYEIKAQEALQDLNKEQQILMAKKEEEQHYYERQAELLQNKINSQMKMLQKQVGKLSTLDAQNETILLKDLASTKQNLSKQLYQTFEVKERQKKVVERQLYDLKEKFKEKIIGIKSKIEQRSAKTRQILNLLLQI